ncbi:29321_t:CDS:2, partial [Gigaspora margarita]
MSANGTAVLRDLFVRNDKVGKDFHKNIRAYNSAFAFTSMGIRLDENLASDTLEFIKSLLDQLNSFVSNFRSISRYSNITNLCLCIKADHGLDQCIYNMPTALQVTAVWIEGNNPESHVKLTARQYYSYRLHFRNPSVALLFYGGRLFQQYVVDNYIKIESKHLNYLYYNQDKICKEHYQ